MREWIIVAGVIFLIMVSYTIDNGWKHDDTPVRAKQAESSTPSGMVKIVAEKAFGCRDKEYLQKIVEYAAQGDKTAASSYIMNGVVDDQCDLFRKGNRVYVADTSLFAGLIKVRREGDAKEYWMPFEFATSR